MKNEKPLTSKGFHCFVKLTGRSSNHLLVDLQLLII